MIIHANPTSVPRFSWAGPVPDTMSTAPTTMLIQAAHRGSRLLARPAPPMASAQTPVAPVAIRSENLLIMLSPATVSAPNPWVAA